MNRDDSLLKKITSLQHYITILVLKNEKGKAAEKMNGRYLVAVPATEKLSEIVHAKNEYLGIGPVVLSVLKPFAPGSHLALAVHGGDGDHDGVP